MHLTELRRIGLTEGEIKVYQAILDLGECTKTALAKQSSVAPSNIYDITNRLLEKGMISKVEKNGIAHFSAANPRHIIDFLGRKEKDIEKEKKIALSLMPLLLQRFEKTKEKVNVEVFQGWKGMKTVFEDLLYECKSGDENLVFGASKGVQDERVDRFFVRYSKLREKKGIKTNVIFNEDLRKREERIEFFLRSKSYNVRFLNQITPAEIMIYKDKTCIIILVKDPFVIRITGNDVAKSFRQYFDIMWKLGKK